MKYSLTHVMQLLGLNNRQLARRLAVLQIVPDEDAYDRRKQMLSQEQLYILKQSLRGEAPVVSSRPVKPGPVQLDLPTLEHSELPAGYVALADVCKRYGLSDSTVADAVRSGRLACHQGRWKVGRIYVKWAFDEEQVQAVLAAYGRS